MFENLEIFRMAHAMARHAGTRQAVIAGNMANADTPGYAARDVPSFQAVFGSDIAGFVPRTKRPGHLSGSADTAPVDVVQRRDATMDPNGNSVSLETEMLNAVDARRQHDRALAIYRSSLGILQTAIGRR